MLKYAKINLLYNKAIEFSDKSDLHISLTSYGKRIKKVFLTIESIANQDMKPASITLWLSREDCIEEELPQTLIKLKMRGVRIKFIDGNIKSYKKLFYSYCEQLEKNSNALLVTADDDVFYDSNWLSGLYNQYKKTRNVICYRGHTISLDKEKNILPYNQWGKYGKNEKHLSEDTLIMPTGIAGVLYPMASLQGLDAQCKDFMELCSCADDLWFKCLTLKNSFSVYQIIDDKRSNPLPVLTRNTKRRGLALYNVHQGGNDLQMSKAMKYFSITFS